MVLTIAEGSSGGTITFTAGFVAAPSAFTLTASYLGVTQTATGMVNPASAAGASASFLTTDTTTQGNWKGKYGAEGYSLVGDLTQNPSYVAPSSDGALYTWVTSTADI